MSEQKPPLGNLEGIIIHSHGCRLLGTLYRARRSGKSPAAIVLHGFPGFEKNYDILRALQQLGYHSLIFHYRGAWGSEGNYTVTGQIDDVKSALEMLRNRPDVDPEKILIVGHSMGSWLAVNIGVIDRQVIGVVAISGVGDMRKRGESNRKRVESSLRFLRGVTYEQYISDMETRVEKYNPVEKIGGISPRPVLIIHGENDAVVKVYNAFDLYEAAKEPKELFVVERADHVFSYQREEVLGRIVSWIEERF